MIHISLDRPYPCSAEAEGAVIAAPPSSRRESVPAEEHSLLRALRDRDEAAFQMLLHRYGSTMQRLARSYVRSREEAEEVVQDTWLAVLIGLERFEARSSLRSWIFKILVNRARTRARREARTLPFSALARGGMSDFGRYGNKAPEHLASELLPWPAYLGTFPAPDERLLTSEIQARCASALALLPRRQREVLILREIEGWSPGEVCAQLGISEVNQRVLLHRARARLRHVLMTRLEPPAPSPGPPDPPERRREWRCATELA